jgi:broad specificity phosphatase PhoE
MARAKTVDWLGVAAPGGETWAQLLQRVSRALDHLKSGPQPAAVVAHQAVNAALAFLAAGVDPLLFHQAYGEVTRVEYD